ERSHRDRRPRGAASRSINWGVADDQPGRKAAAERIAGAGHVHDRTRCDADIDDPVRPGIMDERAIRTHLDDGHPLTETAQFPDRPWRIVPAEPRGHFLTARQKGGHVREKR